ncbi:hypothetical protein K438DRAFT_1840273 [Mycena galopus ATCC 62051]|nr:hypothetical protein K438DRAFT_1840273 [Mycena galopus ATCC 62051]
MNPPRKDLVMRGSERMGGRVHKEARTSGRHRRQYLKLFRRQNTGARTCKHEQMRAHVAQLHSAISCCRFLSSCARRFAKALRCPQALLLLLCLPLRIRDLSLPFPFLRGLRVRIVRPACSPSSSAAFGKPTPADDDADAPFAPAAPATYAQHRFVRHSLSCAEPCVEAVTLLQWEEGTFVERLAFVRGIEGQKKRGEEG